MNTPIADFCKAYAEMNGTRMHMPGHKGVGPLGIEALDLTELKGADSLYEAEGIIAESEANASALFGSRNTFYSCGGSSESIKAMCLLAIRHWRKSHEGTPLVVAGRNAHKSFVQASQLLRFDVEWLFSESTDGSLCECLVTPEGLQNALEELREKGELERVAAVYITSPDYLGNMLDVKGLAEVAHAFGVLLLVDNAHGAYLKFLPEDRHPLTLGADACADSAHKTLPVLTGGGYLHIGASAPEGFEDTARDALCMFGSTSPSYLIMQSLDLCNVWLAEEGEEAFRKTADYVSAMKDVLSQQGVVFRGEEPLKLTINAKASGFETGFLLAEHLRGFDIECEFADKDFVALMISPNNTEADFETLMTAFHMLLLVERVKEATEGVHKGDVGFGGLYLEPEVEQAPYEVLFAETETVATKDALGRVVADTHIACPPAVLPLVPGERVNEQSISVLLSYGVTKIEVVK